MAWTDDDCGPTPGQQMIASCSGALLTSLIATPFDVVKVRLQSQQANYKQQLSKQHCFIYRNGLMDHVCVCLPTKNGTNGSNGVMCQWYERPGHFNGTWDALMKISRNEGLRSLWSGLQPTLVMAVPATVCYFTLYDTVLAKLRKTYPQQSLTVPVLAGCTARVFTATLVSPLELIRTKLQSQRLSYAQLGSAVKDATKQGGFRTLFIGLGPTLLRDVPFSGIYWLFYEYLKSQYLKRMNLEETNFAASFTFGAISGTIAALCTLPFDVIKTHRQIKLGGDMFNREPVYRPSKLTVLMSIQKLKSVSTLFMIKQLYREQGIASLFSGAVPRISKIAPACAIMIGSYEYAKLYFMHKNRENRSLSKEN